MKAVRLHREGGPELLVYEEAPKPQLGAGDALIRVHAKSSCRGWDRAHRTTVRKTGARQCGTMRNRRVTKGTVSPVTFQPRRPNRFTHRGIQRSGSSGAVTGLHEAPSYIREQRIPTARKSHR